MAELLVTTGKQNPGAPGILQWTREGRATPGFQVDTEGVMEVATSLTVAGQPITPGGGGGIHVARAILTTGDVTLPNVGATWTPVSTLNAFSIAAAVGDYVEFLPSFMWLANAGDLLDMAVLVGGSIERFASTGTSSNTTTNEGDPEFYPLSPQFLGNGAVFDLIVASGDLSGGTVTFAMVSRGPGGGKIFASTNYPFRWRAKNYGAPL